MSQWAQLLGTARFACGTSVAVHQNTSSQSRGRPLGAFRPSANRLRRRPRRREKKVLNAEVEHKPHQAEQDLREMSQPQLLHGHSFNLCFAAVLADSKTVLWTTVEVFRVCFFIGPVQAFKLFPTNMALPEILQLS